MTTNTRAEQYKKNRVGRGSILVGVDASDEGQHALEWTAGFARLVGKPILLAHAESPWMGLGMTLPPFDYDTYRDSVHQTVARWGASLRGNLGEIKVIENTAAEGLVLLAAEKDPSLVVLGAHPRRHWTPHVLGSTTTKVLNAAEHPVAVVPQQATPELGTRGLVVGVDGSASSLRALRWTADLGNLLNTSVYALTAFPLEPYAEKPRLADLEGGNPVSESLEALRSLSAQVAQESGRDIASDVVIGHPAEQLLESAADSYALVVGKAGYGSFGDGSLGSISRSCATHAETPVIIVP